MLYEKAEAAFTQDDDDIGCIPSLHNTYASVLKPLQDLLARKWIVKSIHLMLHQLCEFARRKVCSDFALTFKSKDNPRQAPPPSHTRSH